MSVEGGFVFWPSHLPERTGLRARSARKMVARPMAKRRVPAHGGAHSVERLSRPRAPAFGGVGPMTRRVRLDERHFVDLGQLPASLRGGAAAFERLWELRPERFHRIRIGGREVPTPRWQQAFGVDHAYTGAINHAVAVPLELQTMLTYARGSIEPRLDGILVNWYSSELGHYIGAHRDTRTGLRPGAPIVTFSLGALRTFRLRRWKGRDRFDLVVSDGSILVLPYDTNLAWTHEVPHRARDRGRRISVTFRAFEPSSAKLSRQGGRRPSPSSHGSADFG